MSAPHIHFPKAPPTIPAYVREVPVVEGDPHCPQCGEALDLCQPTVRRPDRLVGLCRGEGCGRWWLLCRSDTYTVFIAALLPEETALRAAHVASRPRGQS